MKKQRIVAELLRLIVAAVFIFSGFVKAADPWGTAIKLGEYFRAFSLDGLTGLSDSLAVVLPAAEMVLGLCLLFRIRERAVVLWLALVLGFFTVLTFILALWNPVSDCGCFGDAIKLTNWQTFAKNVVLLVFACVLRLMLPPVYRQRDREKAMVDGSMVFFFTLFSLGIGLYSMRHLPLVDFLPFKAGVHIPSQMEGGTEDIETILIYKDRTSGEQRTFALTDTTWYDTLRWEYVDTQITERPGSGQPTIREFSVFDSDGDHTPALLSSPREVFLITMTDTREALSDRCLQRFESVIRYARRQHADVVCATTSPLPSDGLLPIGSESVPVYNIDGTTLKTLIRARNGLVLLKEGTILGKWNCRDIPPFDEQYAGRPALGVIVERSAQANRMWLLGVLAGAMALIYASYAVHSRKR